MSFDRETIGAFVDGELDEIRRRRIEAAMKDDPELARRVEAERRLRAALDARFGPIADEPIPDRLIGAVRDGGKVAPLTPKRPRWVPVAVAASVALAALAGLQLRPESNPDLASGTLAQALETQLASAQAADARVRIGFTFKARDGAWCRTFEQRAVSGIACRLDEGWIVRRTERGAAPTGDYRQAGSPRIAAAAQDMAADAPLDADAERAIVRGGWRP